MDISALATGIYNVFVADSDLSTALTGGLHNTKAPQDPDSPYAVFQYIAGNDDLTFSSIAEVTTWQFSIFHKSSSPRDKTTIDDAFKKLIAAYDQSEATMTVSGYTVVYVTRGVSNFLETEDDIQQYVINYEIRIDQAR